MAGLTRKRPAHDGRTDKVPSHPQYGFKLNAHDREHRLTFEQALSAYQSGKVSGFGIVLTDSVGCIRGEMQVTHDATAADFEIRGHLAKIATRGGSPRA